MAGTSVDQVRFASAWISAEDEAGRYYGPKLLALPTSEWRSEMNRDINMRRYGTLRYILGEIREDLFHHPSRARERAAVVVEYAARAGVPTPHYFAVLAGLAWKEYANALRYTGELKAAIDAARRSREIFSEVGSLASDAAKAYLVEALVYREQGDLDAVLTIARACAKVFLDFEDSAALVHARMTEALVLSDTKHYKEAMAILAETAADAEKRGDRHTLAICLHNSATCARALGDRATARNLDVHALACFEELGTTVEKPRIRWTEAMALADEGRVSAAIFELYTARAELLMLGMNGDAACYGLDIVRLRYDRDEDVTADCAELVETFSKAGMIQSAIEALAYLREQARQGTISPAKIQQVRDFVHETVKGPPRVFLPPPDGEDGGGV